MGSDPHSEIKKPMPHTQSGGHARVTRLDALIALFMRLMGGRATPTADEGVDPKDFDRFQEGGLRNVGEIVGRHKKRNRAIA